MELRVCGVLDVQRVDRRWDAVSALEGHDEESNVDLKRFEPADFEYDFEHDKLAEHRVTFEEAVG